MAFCVIALELTRAGNVLRVDLCIALQDRLCCWVPGCIGILAYQHGIQNEGNSLCSPHCDIAKSISLTRYNVVSRAIAFPDLGIPVNG